MSFIIDFFKELASVIGFFVDFLVWFVESLLETVTLGINALGTVAYYVSQFPAYWLAPFVAIVTIGIIFKVKG